METSSFPVEYDDLENLGIVGDNAYGILSESITSLLQPTIKVLYYERDSKNLFTHAGYCEIDNEVIFYQSSSEASSVLTLSNLSRGCFNTQTTNHEANAYVEVRSISNYMNHFGTGLSKLQYLIGTDDSTNQTFPRLWTGFTSSVEQSESCTVSNRFKDEYWFGFVTGSSHQLDADTSSLASCSISSVYPKSNNKIIEYNSTNTRFENFGSYIPTSSDFGYIYNIHLHCVFFKRNTGATCSIPNYIWFKVCDANEAYHADNKYYKVMSLQSILDHTGNVFVYSEGEYVDSYYRSDFSVSLPIYFSGSLEIKFNITGSNHIHIVGIDDANCDDFTNLTIRKTPQIYSF